MGLTIKKMCPVAFVEKRLDILFLAYDHWTHFLTTVKLQGHIFIQTQFDLHIWILACGFCPLMNGESHQKCSWLLSLFETNESCWKRGPYSFEGPGKVDPQVNPWWGKQRGKKKKSPSFSDPSMKVHFIQRTWNISLCLTSTVSTVWILLPSAEIGAGRESV